MAPGSSPPWPGSSAMMIRRSVALSSTDLEPFWPLPIAEWSPPAMNLKRPAQGAKAPGSVACWALRWVGEGGAVAAGSPGRLAGWAISSPSGSQPGRWQPRGRRRDRGCGGCSGISLLVLQAFGDQRLQRVGHLGRVQIKHQPVPVGGHRGQVKTCGSMGASGPSPGAPRRAHSARRGCRRYWGRRGAPWPPVRASAGFRSMPSMSTARRGGLATKVCLAFRGRSDSMVTRE